MVEDTPRSKGDSLWNTGTVFTPIDHPGSPALPLPFKEEPSYLWSNFSGALIELLFGEVGDWMGEDQKPVVRYPPRLGHGLGCPHELVGDDGG